MNKRLDLQLSGMATGIANTDIAVNQILQLFLKAGNTGQYLTQHITPGGGRIILGVGIEQQGGAFDLIQDNGLLSGLCYRLSHGSG
ncbi:MAG: hypothetical protein QF449_08485 [Alphaproteobacteria bacterium]|jgi:hypothetical protein|nr:hypothetical protein [Alphaproteobacteria bacterium]MDP6589329.1 hypothetical protein [Alphaproteobacteria bacterium]MDP6818064.1 hypothetical protein [Alphaproteobacteria bacterium]